jgi:rhodanese-related sulfurtransferase
LSGRCHIVTDINRQTVLELIDAGAQVVDVLPEREFNSGHIPGAVNIPLKTLTAETVSILRRDKPVVVY